jgi:hypothetical protein
MSTLTWPPKTGPACTEMTRIANETTESREECWGQGEQPCNGQTVDSLACRQCLDQSHERASVEMRALADRCKRLRAECQASCKEQAGP